MVFMRGMRSSQGAGELPPMEGCVPVAGLVSAGWTAAVRQRPLQAGAGQDRGAALTQMHRRVVWSGLAGQDAIIGAAAPGGACAPSGDWA
jgi:hypothetical protein